MVGDGIKEIYGIGGVVSGIACGIPKTVGRCAAGTALARGGPKTAAALG